MTEPIPSPLDGVPALQWDAITQAAIPAALVQALRAQDVQLSLRDNRLWVDTLPGLLSPDLKAFITRHQAEILTVLWRERRFERRVLTIVARCGEPTAREVALLVHRPVQQVRTLLEQFVAREIIEARPVKQGSFRYRLRREMASGGEQ
jgi:hypothetical protein